MKTYRLLIVVLQIILFLIMVFYYYWALIFTCIFSIFIVLFDNLFIIGWVVKRFFHCCRTLLKVVFILILLISILKIIFLNSGAIATFISFIFAFILIYSRFAQLLTTFTSSALFGLVKRMSFRPSRLNHFNWACRFESKTIVSLTPLLMLFLENFLAKIDVIWLKNNRFMLKL